MEEEFSMKSNTDILSSKNLNKSPNRAHDSVPYHRTCGARFCPNGNILGKSVFCRLVYHNATNETENISNTMNVSIQLISSLISVIFVNPTFEHSHNHSKSQKENLSLETDTKEMDEG